MSDASIFETHDLTTTDLIWEQDSRIKDKLSNINRYLLNYSLPTKMITFVGKESSGKTTLINRFIGLTISNTSMATCNVAPTYIHLYPSEEFKIEYDEIEYNKSNINEFQKAFEFKVHGMKNKTIDRNTQHIHIYGPSYPNVILVDLPGYKKGRGPDSDEYKMIQNHLRENFGKNNKIVLVHSLDNPYWHEDEVALCINNVYELGGRYLLKKHIANKKIMCVATCMDKSYGEIRDLDEKTFSQIENCERRINIGKEREHRQYDIVDYFLPGIHCMLTVSLDDVSLGEEQNDKEKEFFDNTIENYNKVLEWFVEERYDQKEVEECNKKRKIWISHINNNSGIKAFRNHIIDYIINCYPDILSTPLVKSASTSYGCGGGGGGGGGSYSKELPKNVSHDEWIIASPQEQTIWMEKYGEGAGEGEGEK